MVGVGVVETEGDGVQLGSGVSLGIGVLVRVGVIVGVIVGVKVGNRVVMILPGVEVTRGAPVDVLVGAKELVGVGAVLSLMVTKA